MDERSDLTLSQDRKKNSAIPRILLLVETSRSFGRELLYGIARYSRIHGPWVFYREVGALEQSARKLLGWDADGFITRNPVDVSVLDDLTIPGILVIHHENKLPTHFPTIVTDSPAIGKMAADHLMERGYKHFAFCGLDQLRWSNERCHHFVRRLHECGHQVHVYRQSRTRMKQSWKYEQKYMADWISSLPHPVGILACNDDRGQQAIEACKIARIRVPDEVGVLGVDNDELICELSDPPMSSIALNIRMAGYQAAELLEKLIRGEAMTGQRIVVTATHIQTRQSTDIMAVSDREVADAIRFIYQNSNRSIQVMDVANAVALSRSALEKRFRKAINTTIHEKIRQIRIEKITRILIETDLAISQIAQQMGFPGIEHIARYFRTEKGMSLQAYRKKYGSV